MESEVKDSFGQVVQVGDFLAYAPKTQYLGSLSIGLVTKLYDSGGVAMIAVNTQGMSLGAYLKHRQDTYDTLVANGYDCTKGYYAKYRADAPVAFKTRLASATTCFKILPHALPEGIATLLTQAK